MTPKFKISDTVYYPLGNTYASDTITGLYYNKHVDKIFYTLAHSPYEFLETELFSNLDEAFTKENECEETRHKKTIESITNKFSILKIEEDKKRKEISEKKRDDKGRFTSKQKNTSWETNKSIVNENNDLNDFQDKITKAFWDIAILKLFS